MKLSLWNRSDWGNDMKAIFLNASPRKNWNTAQLLKSAQKGAEAAGAETDYIDLYDLSFTGCRSCLACKRKGAVPCRCYWKDDLSPLLDRIFAADDLFVGSPIYLGDTTSQFHALIERMGFVMLSYNDYSCLFKGHLNVGVILTMNASEEYYKQFYVPKLKDQMDMFRRFGGKVDILAGCDTLQVKDYSRYDMAAWDGEHKKTHREEQFPKDLDKAYEMGMKLIGK